MGSRLWAGLQGRQQLQLIGGNGYKRLSYFVAVFGTTLFYGSIIPK